MNFGRIATSPCVNTPPPRDTRCDDPAFALANPGLCPIEPSLVVKPSFALACALGSVQFKAFYVQGNTETDVTAQAVFQTSDPNTAVVGAASGNATGLSAGTATISATYLGINALAELTVLGDNCCDDRHVAMMLVMDRSRSMSQAFSPSYSTKLGYAKSAATRFINEVNQSKDFVGLMQFTSASNEVLSSPVSNKSAVGTMVPGISQTLQNTTFYDALKTAIDELANVSADLKVLVLFSDGEDTDTSYLDGNNPISLLSDFKTAGGIVMCFGVRAHDRGYGLLSNFATGGFFINSYSATADDSLDYLSGLKGYVCAGNCTPAGDEFKAAGKLNYCGFDKWAVVDGHVDLVGNGFLDLLPGNGLYVDLAGSRAPYKGTLLLRDSLAVEAGKKYRMNLDLAGNQRVNSTPNSVRVKIFSRNNDGIPNQDLSSAPVLTDGAGSAASETYEYAFSYLSPYGETILTPAVSKDNEGFETFNIEVTSDAPLDVVGIVSAIRFWKRELGTSKWYLIAEGSASTPSFTDTYNNARLTAAIASGAVDECIKPSDSNTTGTPIVLLNQTLTVNNFQQGFQTNSLTFTAPTDANVFISIQQTETPPGADSIGLLLDNVKFTNATDLVTLFTDSFDSENMQYVPPACGIGTNYVLIDDSTYGYVTGDNCYGEGCLSQPPAAQASDPNPLPEIELGVTPPTLFTSNKTACATCGAGFINLGDNLIPTMTSNTAPSGEASSSTVSSSGPAWKAFDKTNATWLAADNAVPVWLQYKLATAKTARAYGIKSGKGSRSPKSFELLGSNDGSSWDTLDSRENVIWASFQTKRWLVTTPASYLYYRLNITALTDLVTGSTPEANLAEFELFEVPQAAVCDSASAESEVSQGAADAAALAAATAVAQAKLNCVAAYTVTEVYTAVCAAGTFGQQVTKSATVTSLISQSEAEQDALAQATESANAELDCTQSNNTQKITILDSSSDAPGPATAMPYGSVKHITGLTGLVTKVTVQLNGLTHSFTDDIHMLLLAPDGVTYVELMANCGGNNSTIGINLVLDDAAGSSLPDSAAIVSGTFKPTQFGVTGLNFYPTPAPQGVPQTALAAFIGIDGNGSWSLWICDDQNGGSGTLDSWDLIITSA